jgi:hypothetical protein
MDVIRQAQELAEEIAPTVAARAMVKDEAVPEPEIKVSAPATWTRVRQEADKAEQEIAAAYRAALAAAQDEEDIEALLLYG